MSYQIRAQLTLTCTECEARAQTAQRMGRSYHVMTATYTALGFALATELAVRDGWYIRDAGHTILCRTHRPGGVDGPNP